METIVYGYSDDLVEIESDNGFREEIDCWNSDVRIRFNDGTIIRVGYSKPGFGVWYIFVENEGTAEQELKICYEESDSGYSDVFQIGAEYESHEKIEKRTWLTEEILNLQASAAEQTESKPLIDKKDWQPGDIVFVVKKGKTENIIDGYIFLAKVTDSAVIVLHPFVERMTLDDALKHLFDWTKRGMELPVDVYPIESCFSSEEFALDHIEF